MSGAERIVKEGVIAGLLACVSVIALFSLLDGLAGQSIFYTPAAMGSILFYGVDDPTKVAIAAGPVLAYNGVHLVGSIAVGLIAAFVMFETELHRSLWYFFFVLIIAAFTYAVTVLGVFSVEIGGVVDWSTVVAGTAVWTTSMMAYFWWVHPGLVAHIQEDLEREL